MQSRRRKAAKRRRRHPRPPKLRKCPHCKAEIATPGATICPNCNKPLNPNAPTCAQTPAKYVDNPLAGVYDPERLRVLDKCIQLTGKVMRVSHEKDGDYHIQLALQAPDTHYLVQNQKYLVVEIIPIDQPTVVIPEKGQRITATGPWVYDTRHGFNEIHPAWSIIPA